MKRQNFLAHQGVKGMKWGVRKRYKAERSQTLASSKQVAKNGKTVVAQQYKDSRFVSALRAAFPNKMKNVGREKVFSLNVDGKKVGMSSFEHRPDGEINLTYLGINKKDRGQGYASAAMQQAIAYGKQSNAKKLTLEVPAGVPDALHIYEKHGFKVVPGSSASGDEYGLIPMAYKINSVKHADSLSDDDDLERAFDLTFKFSPEDLEKQGNSLAMSSQYLLDRQEFLIHYGVKGMRWGQRRAQNRADKAAYKSEFIKHKMEQVLKTALDAPESIINVYGRQGYDTVPSNMLVLGRESVEDAKMGKIMDAMYTDVYAYSNKGKDGKTGYTYNENFNARYVASPKPTRDRA